MKIRKIISMKNRYNRIYSVPADTNVKDAVSKLCEHNAGALLVTDPANAASYVGIISERDILKYLSKDFDGIKNVKVSELMTKDMIVADIDDDVIYVERVMTDKKIRHIPVIENSKVVGLLSIRHIIEALHEEDETKIRYLSDYVYGQKDNEVF